MSVISINGKKIIPAASWNELNLRQLSAIAKVLVSYWNVISVLGSKFKDKKLFKMTMSHAKKEPQHVILRQLLNLSWYTYSKLTASQCLDLFQVTEFIFKDIKLTRNNLERIRIGYSWYCGPDDRLNNISIDEFIMADLWYMRYRKTGKESALNHLISVLYRKKAKDIDINSSDFKGDLREAYNEYTYTQRSNKIARLSSLKKNIILLYYMGCRNHLEITYKEVFKHAVKSNVKVGDSELKKVALSMSGGAFGNYKDTLQTNVHDFFSHWNELLKHNRKNK